MKHTKVWIARSLVLVMLACPITPSVVSAYTQCNKGITCDRTACNKQLHCNKATIKKVQQQLCKKGYACGTTDGISGSKTKQAIKCYQKDHHMEVTGTINSNLLKSLNVKQTSKTTAKNNNKTSYVHHGNQNGHHGNGHH